ncbi:hypothetical protein DM02DRAFT_664422 [Periconia macrospinosa]|uniref:Uncharacterized protein n=1 Tax=Periconia macrospinosa TaxID=97972 RepID=A0A2V1CZA0_9PLEO|nr:hypothetical protein DM02DRAFT_664422 [Periconia macrospinosa]
MSSPNTSQLIAKVKEFAGAGVKDQVKLYRENKEFRKVFIDVLGPAYPGLTFGPSPLYRFFREMHDPEDRTCCPDQTEQECVGSASQAEVFSQAPIRQRYYLIRELKHSPQVVKLIMYLPEIQQAEVFSSMFEDWERGDLADYNPKGAEKLLQICAKVQKAENWYSDGKICVATENFPKTRTCSFCKKEFTAVGYSNIRPWVTGHPM